jgi:hypothetical protein
MMVSSGGVQLVMLTVATKPQLQHRLPQSGSCLIVDVMLLLQAGTSSNT